MGFLSRFWPWNDEPGDSTANGDAPDPQHDAHDEREREAEEALARSRAARVEAERAAVEMDDITRRLRYQRTKNHFGPALEQVMRGHHEPRRRDASDGP